MRTQTEIFTVDSVVSLIWKSNENFDECADENTPCELWGGDEIIAQMVLLGEHEATRWCSMYCYGVQVCYATWKFSAILSKIP